MIHFLMSRATIEIENTEEVQALLGINDAHTRLFRQHLGVSLTVRNGELHIDGEDAEVVAAERIAQELLRRHRVNGVFDSKELELMLRAGGSPAHLEGAGSGGAFTILPALGHRAAVHGRTPNQHAYVDAMLKNELVFGIGPAGTGKTYLAVAMALRKLKDGEVKKLILTRPAVEAGIASALRRRLSSRKRTRNDGARPKKTLFDPLSIYFPAAVDTLDVKRKTPSELPVPSALWGGEGDDPTPPESSLANSIGNSKGSALAISSLSGINIDGLVGALGIRCTRHHKTLNRLS